MKVTRTLWDIHRQIESLLKQRDMAKDMIAHCIIEDHQNLLDSYVKDYRHFEEVLEHLCGIEVTFENEYETEDEE